MYKGKLLKPYKGFTPESGNKTFDDEIGRKLVAEGILEVVECTDPKYKEPKKPAGKPAGKK